MQREILENIYYQDARELAFDQVLQQGLDYLKELDIKNIDEIKQKLQSLENEIKIFSYREVDEIEVAFDGFEFTNNKSKKSINDLAAEIRNWLKQYFNDRKIDIREKRRSIILSLKSVMRKLKRTSSKILKWNVEENQKELQREKVTYKVLKELRYKLMNLDSLELYFLFVTIKYSLPNDYDHLVK